MKKMMMLLFMILLLLISQCYSFQLKPSKSSMLLSNRLTVSMNTNDDSKNELIIGSTGTVANLICGYSLYVLKTTGCGLPPGPFGLEGAFEGISYLEVIGIVAWSLITKIKTGGGLNEGPYGILGLAEGLGYLVIIGGIVIAGLNLNDYGFLPGFLPNDQCYGINN